MGPRNVPKFLREGHYWAWGLPSSVPFFRKKNRVETFSKKIIYKVNKLNIS